MSIDDSGKIALSIKQLQAKQPEAQAQTGNSSFRPQRQSRGPRDFRRGGRYNNTTASFEDKLSKFLKDSDERLTDLRRKTDSKRGGRGSRRSD